MNQLLRELKRQRAEIEAEYQETSQKGPGRAYLMRHLMTLDMVIDRLGAESIGTERVLVDQEALDSLREYLQEKGASS